LKKWYKNTWFLIIVGIIILALIIYVVYKLRNMLGDNLRVGRLKDESSEKVVQKLHPKIRDKAREFIVKAEQQGIILRITSGLRTWEEQDALYDQGRTKPGNVVTNAKGGSSNHNYGLAFDVVPIENGNVNWNSKNWSKIGQIGKSVGFDWGGDWSGFVDKPHFEMLFGNNVSSLKKMYLAGKRDGNYVNVA
jgi:peptidoglycan L-alanyl-D-glutamate endopeptidase CwlK